MVGFVTLSHRNIFLLCCNDLLLLLVWTTFLILRLLFCDEKIEKNVFQIDSSKDRDNNNDDDNDADADDSEQDTVIRHWHPWMLSPWCDSIELSCGVCRREMSLKEEEKDVAGV